MRPSAIIRLSRLVLHGDFNDCMADLVLKPDTSHDEGIGRFVQRYWVSLEFTNHMSTVS